MPWSSLILTCFISCQLQKIINTRLRSEDTDVVAAKYFDLCAVTGDMTLTDAGIAFVFRLKQTPPWERGSTIWQSMSTLGAGPVGVVEPVLNQVTTVAPV